MHPPWLGDRRAEWLVDATRWLTDVVASLRLGSILDITPVRERPWGAVLRVTTSDRALIFKAEGLGAGHEPSVLDALARQWPDLVPDVLAADGARSWLLMADHGQPMWDVLEPGAQVAIWERVLPQYAQVQGATAHSVGTWMDAGVPDRRVHRLPELLDTLLAGQSPGGPLPIAAAPRRAIDALLPAFARVCENLASTSYAAALDHGDLHGGNVLVSGADARLADWGDSCVTHPFASLFVTYQLALHRFGPADRAAAGPRLRDAYLEAWSGFDAPAALREAFTLAVWVGHVTRALDFAHMLRDAPAALIPEWRGHTAAVLRRWQEAHALLDQPERFLSAIQP